MSLPVQFPVDHSVPGRSVPDSPGLFLILLKSRCGEVVDNWVHASFELFGAKDLLVAFDIGLVKSFHRDRD